MERPWPSEALDFEDSIAAVLDRLGGVDFTRACERNPTLRTTRLEPELRALGLVELDPHTGAVEAAAAALAARAAGAVVAPWPLAAQLATPLRLRLDVGPVHLVAGTVRRAEHLDLTGRGVAVDIQTLAASRLEVDGGIAGMPLDPFGVPCRRGDPVSGIGREVVSAHVVLTAFYVLGAVERATELASAYASDRRQFGRPIASFGAIQWRLSDLALAQAGLRELAGWTLMRFIDGEATMADALALRLQTLDSANAAMANAHQILGAIGLCEEHDVAVIDRHLQGCLRRPTGFAATNTLLAERIAAEGFDALFSIPAASTDGSVARAHEASSAT